MLVDDDLNDIFFHERVIGKVDPTIIVIAKNSGPEALEYLKSKQDKENQHPCLIFLDINMPGMNGWDFLQEYNLLDNEVQRHKKIIMLTTSENPDDLERANSLSVISDYIPKPLTKEILENIVEKYFKN